jgi:hypothetical protein
MENSSSQVYSASCYVLSDYVFKNAQFLMVAEILAKKYQFSLVFSMAVDIKLSLYMGRKWRKFTFLPLSLQPVIINKILNRLMER